LPENSLLVTLDVGSLYTNIPNEEGISACKTVLERYRAGETTPSNKSLVELLRLVLYKNNFEFNEKHYLQVGGTAMGTRVAPSFANIFMSSFEEKFVYTYETQPLIWLRYIDDIFCIWTAGENELQKFITHLNNCHPSIKFTQEFGTEKIAFLDTAISIHRGKLVSNLYTKPTDSHNYLLFTSCHPKHTKEAIPYSQMIRVRRICTFTLDFIENGTMLKKHFLRRGYPRDLVEEAFEKALDTDRETLLKPKSKTKQDGKESPVDKEKIFLTTTYSPGLKTPMDIIQSNWPLLGTSNLTTEVYEARLIHGHRRCANVKSEIVRAKIPPLTNKGHKGGPKCKTKNCNYCPKLNKSGHITSSFNGRRYVSKHNVSCKSNNLIYCITCKKCGKQYVGQTKRRLMDRCAEHFYHIKKKDRSFPIGRHFNLPQHSGIEDVEIHIVDFIYCKPDSLSAAKLRDKIEKNWILRLRTSAPHGINTMDVKYQSY